MGDRLLLMPIPTSAMDVNPLLKDEPKPWILMFSVFFNFLNKQ